MLTEVDPDPDALDPDAEENADMDDASVQCQ
jgi:hypothetical protein